MNISNTSSGSYQPGKVVIQVIIILNPSAPDPKVSHLNQPHNATATRITSTTPSRNSHRSTSLPRANKIPTRARVGISGTATSGCESCLRPIHSQSASLSMHAVGEMTPFAPGTGIRSGRRGRLVGALRERSYGFDGRGSVGSLGSDCLMRCGRGGMLIVRGRVFLERWMRRGKN